MSRRVIVVTRTGADVPMKHGRDVRYAAVRDAPVDRLRAGESMNAEDPLFILYTSGSTGTAQGRGPHHRRLCGVGGDDLRLDVRPRDDDIFWCTADIGWITGHSYVVYGPLMMRRDQRDVRRRSQLSRLRAASGRPSTGWASPSSTPRRPRSARSSAKATSGSRDHRASRCACSERSASRSIPMRGNGIGASSATAGCPIVDTWWQTETGGILISPFPGATADEAGIGDQAAARRSSRCWSIREHRVLDGAASGNLCLRTQLAGADAHRVGRSDSASSRPISPTYPGLYFTGDGCRRDEDGYYWITGRVDDVINVSGHRIGTAEVESALGRPPAQSPRPRSSASRTTSRARRSTPSSP